MSDKLIPEALYEAGFHELISVTPPGAQLVPSSKITPSALGKAPGRRLSNGLYAGYDWRRFEATIDDVRKWAIDGANIGLKADHFPGVDIDVLDPQLAQIIEDFALAKLGPAPVRIGRAPKRLLMYRTAEPFSRMRLFIKKGDTQHLVEILGSGQQYLVYGTHPTTMRPYSWTGLRNASDLVEITREKADAFLTELADMLDMLGVGTITREGDGRRQERVVGDQAGLLAPSVDVLRDAVAMIPNNDEFFPSREDYIKMGVAIRAAAGDENEPEGYDIFAGWAKSHEADGRVAGNPDTWYGDWRRIKGPYSVGWSWIAEQARSFGFNDASLDFTADAPAPEDDTTPRAPEYSEQWLAHRIVARKGGEIRYSPERGMYYVWNGARWEPDAELRADDLISRELLYEADLVMRRGVTEKEQAKSLDLGQRLCSASTASHVRTFVQQNRGIAIALDALDHDVWMLNTPGGIVDLKTGALLPADPDALCTKSTAVPPDFGGAAPEFKRFLAEATGGDRALEGYLQRLAGYSLTGSTREQNLTFIYGSGGNGKGTFLHTISGIMGDYARTAQMDTFTASHGDKHPTDVAMLVGARLVVASETQAGKRWDEAKVKQMTGGDPITARFMRQDSFTYMPQFKLVFIGNHRPEIRDIDDAMKRRVQIVPFTVKPARVDRELMEKLRAEWPAILAWMIEGCLLWQRDGLQPPEKVRAATAEYFTEEDAVGRWLQEATEREDDAHATTAELYESWREWANRNGEHVGSQKRLSAALVARGIPRWREGSTRRMGFSGVRVRAATEFPVL